MPARYRPSPSRSSYSWISSRVSARRSASRSGAPADQHPGAIMRGIASWGADSLGMKLDDTMAGCTANHTFHSPDLSPPSGRIAGRRRSNENGTRHAPPWRLVVPHPLMT